MLTYTLRRLLLAIPTLLLISLVIFLLVDFAPGSPAAEIPLTVPMAVSYTHLDVYKRQTPYVVGEPATGHEPCQSRQNAAQIAQIADKTIWIVAPIQD